MCNRMTRFNPLGSAGDSLSHHRNRSWSTSDQDNDEWEKNCAESRHGAWWYVSCYHSNLNGRYRHRPDSLKAYGVVWRGWGGQKHLLKRTEMKLRPIDFWLSWRFTLKPPFAVHSTTITQLESVSAPVPRSGFTSLGQGGRCLLTSIFITKQERTRLPSVFQDRCL